MDANRIFVVALFFLCGASIALVGIGMGRLIGLVLGDVLLTRAELQGLMDELLISDQAPSGETRFSEWLEAHKHEVGSVYSSELHQHFQRHTAA